MRSRRTTKGCLAISRGAIDASHELLHSFQRQSHSACLQPRGFAVNSTWTLGYCTNVHAGTDLDSIRANLDRFAVPVRTSVFGTQPMGVGLWIPAEASRSLVAGDTAAQFADWLRQRSLTPYTINGFPYDNFHQPVVKHRVYDPPWWEKSRLEYTRDLATILGHLLPAEQTGSISTLPLGWPNDKVGSAAIEQSGLHLRQLAEHLESIEKSSGRRIVVAIEPEPGCLLDRAEDVVAFFEKHLPDSNHRRYLAVCHDICHSAVMFEDQANVLGRYAAAGVTVGKVQVSNAIEVDWSYMSTARRQEAMEQLSNFAEDRYLHQTGRCGHAGGFSLAEDLPQIVHEDAAALTDACWRVHFHLPVFLERFGHLNTTREAIATCLTILASADAPNFTGHTEIETYAWGVLPEAMRKRGLVEDIASEMRWLKQLLTEQNTRLQGETNG